MLKTCIWCLKNSEETSFSKKAHSIPKSLGGVYICENVCDECNKYFGSPSNQMPAVEHVFKEVFNITRARFLMATNEFGGKNKTLPYLKSQYFNVNYEKNTIDLKFSFKIKNSFQTILCRQFKRGLYKVFLEELERQNQIGLDKRFNFIREFARYNLGDYPVLYFRRKVPLILIGENEAKNPVFRFDNKMNYELKEYGFFEVEFLGHLFSFPLNTIWKFYIEQYFNKTVPLKMSYFEKPILINYLTDIDLTLNVMNIL
jgi:hypothetical protein